MTDPAPLLAKTEATPDRPMRTLVSVNEHGPHGLKTRTMVFPTSHGWTVSLEQGMVVACRFELDAASDADPVEIMAWPWAGSSGLGVAQIHTQPDPLSGDPDSESPADERG